jgi:hypothetical protein
MPEYRPKIEKIIKLFASSTAKDDDEDCTSPTIKMSTVNKFGVYLPPSPNYYNDDDNWLYCRSKQTDYFKIKS